MKRYGGLIFGIWLASLSPLALAADTSGTTQGQAATTTATTTSAEGTAGGADASTTNSDKGDASSSQSDDQKSGKDKAKKDKAKDDNKSGATGSADTQGQDAQEQGTQQESGVEAAREALKQKKSDVTSEKNLEQVFEAAQKQYSLLRSGGMDMTLAGSYSYYGSDSIDIHFNNSGSLDRFRILNNAQHSFGGSLSFDYGIWDNLTFSTTLPVVYQYDTQKDVSKAALGDVSLGLRYQPFPVVSGGVNTTLFGTLSTATGDSPYKINPNTEVSSGKGYYSLGGGVSLSRVIDPVVLFGSMGYTLAFNATGLNQEQSTRVLKKVDPGDSLSFSFGLAYSLSYDVSISGSYQQSYNFPSKYYFDDGSVVQSQDSTTGVMNMSLGLRTSSNRIVNVSFGFGLTPDSPDVMLGISLPVDLSGLKTGA
jgi:hypothetical protein